MKIPQPIPPKKKTRTTRDKRCGGRSFSQSSGSTPSGIIYQRGLSVDWSGRVDSVLAGDEGDQFSTGLLAYVPAGAIRQELDSGFERLLNDNIIGNRDRFEPVFSGDAIMIDHLTGKVWAWDHALLGSDKTWANALTEVAARNTAAYKGRTNWRVPTIRELIGLSKNIGDANGYGHLQSMIGTFISSTLEGSGDTNYLAFDPQSGLVSSYPLTTAKTLFMVCNDLS